MAINISIPEQNDLKPKLCVFGVGGAGGNAVNNMIESKLSGVDLWVANTDAQALEHSKVPQNRIQLGIGSTQGLGAGSYAEVGKLAAEESWAELSNALDGYNMVFITGGMGGGTGTGAGPVIAKLAKEEKGILTVGVVTKPFHFEGKKRMEAAEKGLEEMYKYCDTLIIIPNQNLFRVANERTTFADAFRMADEVLLLGVRGVSDLITMPGLVNLDFADIRTVMSASGGKAMMGTGEAEGDERALKAAEAAISNPLLDSSSMRGARGVIINITGGTDMTLFEVEAAVERVREEVDPDANIIFGSAFNAELQNKIKVSVVATGIDNIEPQRHGIHPAANRISKSFEVNDHTAAANTSATANARYQEEGSQHAEMAHRSQNTAHFDADAQHASVNQRTQGVLDGMAEDAENEDMDTDYSAGFIPPKVQEPKQTEIGGVMHYAAATEAEGAEDIEDGEEYEDEDGAPMSDATASAIAAAGAALSAKAPGSHNAAQEEPAPKSGISLLGRVAASLKVGGREQPSRDMNKADEDFFDVPAFMRRRSGEGK